MTDRATTAWLARLALMAALVATLAYFPLGLALIFTFLMAGVGFESAISFGGNLPMLVGLIVWWLLAFSAALVYAAFMLPHAAREP